MTYERAVEILDPEHREHYESIDIVDEACRMGMEALKKQIPKKPYDVNTESKTFDCPECLSKLYADEDVRDCSYCCVCGQALDWRDNE